MLMATVWAITVAVADPWMPHPKPKISRGLKMQLQTTAVSMTNIALVG